MPRPPPPDPDAAAGREVEGRVEDLGDPEGGPANPSATLAAGAGSWSPFERLARTGATAEIWRLAWPVMLSQVLVAASGLVDIAMVGRLGAEAQAAVGYATQFFFFAQSALFAIGFSCVALMARAIGAGDLQRARRAQAASLGLAVAVALGLASVVLSAPHTLLSWLAAEPRVIALCVPYLRLVMAASVILAACLVLESGLRANRDTRTPMRIAALVTTVKVVLNALLIFGLAGFPRLELVGAGVATVASQLLALVLFVGVLRRQPAAAATALEPRSVQGAGQLMGPLVRIALPGVAERVVMNLAMLSYFAVLGRYGTTAVAAYTIGVRVLSFSWIPGIGYSQAVGTLVGQSLGAEDPAAAVRSGWRAVRMALATALALGLLGGLLREPLARLFTVSPEVVAELGPFMLCLAIAQPVLQLHFTLAGVHRGAGDTWTPLLATLVGNWVFRVPLAVVFATVLEWPLIWVWVALILDHVARAAWLLASFRRGRWRFAGA